MMNSAPMKSITTRSSRMMQQHCSSTRRWIVMASPITDDNRNLDRTRCSLHKWNDSSAFQSIRSSSSSQVLQHENFTLPSYNSISNSNVAISLCQLLSARRAFSTTNNNNEEEDKFIIDVGREGIPQSDPSTIDRSKFTERIKIRMPDMGEGNNKIVEWYKQEGDMIATGDLLCDIETPEFTFGMTSDDECDAIMDKIFVSVGDPVRDEEVICEILHPHEDNKGEENTPAET
eukprot:CAMPEP_0195298224 /NCGR_PEP_ID=MMETSP0707-20130614/23022_1 /TAXON_ID=33640 /ORGANISM="Asterionellopsis glacialis, Strain CCMP134" /LENGTH=231 /DNA_ID=CAMNT_0040360249 /DNA_START=97 /DNA_END=792 /DNA_ORIENTATION=+